MLGESVHQNTMHFTYPSPNTQVQKCNVQVSSWREEEKPVVFSHESTSVLQDGPPFQAQVPAMHSAVTPPALHSSLPERALSSSAALSLPALAPFCPFFSPKDLPSLSRSLRLKCQISRLFSPSRRTRCPTSSSRRFSGGGTRTTRRKPQTSHSGGWVCCSPS